jgi:hypothetical protein
MKVQFLNYQALEIVSEIKEDLEHLRRLKPVLDAFLYAGWLTNI